MAKTSLIAFFGGSLQRKLMLSDYARYGCFRPPPDGDRPTAGDYSNSNAHDDNGGTAV